MVSAVRVVVIAVDQVGQGLPAAGARRVQANDVKKCCCPLWVASAPLESRCPSPSPPDSSSSTLVAHKVLWLH